MSKSRLRVALLTNRFLPQIGGAEININHQACYLARDVDLTVFCPKRVEGRDTEERDGFRIVRLRDRANPEQVFPNNKANTFCPAIFFKILFGGFDILHCFPALNRNNMLALLAAKLSGTRTVLCFFDYLNYAEIIRASGSVDPDILKKHEPNFKTKWFLKSIDQIYAISNWEIDFLKRFNPNVEYSPVPVLVDEFRAPAPSPRSKYGIGGDEFVFLCVNRISEIKGQDLAMEAFCKTAAQLPGARMVFVGNDKAEPAVTERMKALAGQAGVADRVLFTGLVEREELLGWLQHSDIQVVPARFMNSGAVVVESWISGTPVIQSEAVDPNLVEPGKNGWLFPTANVDALAAQMREALANRAALRSMAEAGRALVMEKYTYEYLNNLYLETYRRITGTAS